ncbi:MAG: hypothetical protein JZU59_16280 [Chromatium okenii]|nr:hypothetical protein [Chromatium okenii]
MLFYLQCYDQFVLEQLYHGTLAVRNLVSATALQHIKHSGVENIFLDVNLRTPWWSLGKTIALLEEAHWVKLNRDELLKLSALTLDDIAPPLETVAQHFLQQHQLTGLIVTLGSKGVLGLNQDGACIQIEPPPACTLVDTVGAGDAFSAVALFGLMQQWDFTTLLNRAQQFATHIVEQRGAISTERTWYQTMLNQWNSH